MTSPETPGRGGARKPLGSSAPVVPLQVSIGRIVVVGTSLWVLALAITLLVPALHTGERSWWPWACVSGIGLGIFAHLYVRRGRGNAEGV